MLIQLKRKFYLPLIALITVSFFLACKKDIDNSTTVPIEIPDLSAKVNASVSGFVTDENNAPVAGAAVKVGTTNTTTDDYGFFEAKNVDVVKVAAVVTIAKPGYFNSIKTWGASAGKSAFFRIKMIPKTIAGTIDGSAGGNVTLTNGTVIALPAYGVVTASNNAAYSGAVNVAVKWLDPEANDLNQIMPGDLRGLDNDGALKGLTTFGMVAVELSGASGELLQVASGKKATVTMPLSATLSAAAPASIPLWYFDESKGLWKEDGAASKTGNSYVGEVSHFSYWNCDLPNAIVPLTFTVTDQSGAPVGNTYVDITPTATGYWGHVGGYTDGTGVVSVFVTPNSNFLLEIFSSCGAATGTPEYTQNFSSGTTAIDLGNIVLPSSNTANISGTITNCSGNAVTSGSVLVKSGWYYSRYYVDNSGAFNFNVILCNGATTFEMVAEDFNNAQQSTLTSYTINPGANNIGSIAACGINASEFIDYSIDGGATIHLTWPGDSIAHTGNGSDLVSIIMGSSNSSGPANNEIYFSFENMGTVVGSSKPLITFSTSSIADQTTVTTPIDVHITEFGQVGEYIAGNFSGTVTGMAPANTPYVVTCSFRARRNF